MPNKAKNRITHLQKLKQPPIRFLPFKILSPHLRRQSIQRVVPWRRRQRPNNLHRRHPRPTAAHVLALHPKFPRSRADAMATLNQTPRATIRAHHHRPKTPSRPLIPIFQSHQQNPQTHVPSKSQCPKLRAPKHKPPEKSPRFPPATLAHHP